MKLNKKITKYRKKPVVVEAFKMTEARRMDNSDWTVWLHSAWNGERNRPGTLQRINMSAQMPDELEIVTLEGRMKVDWGDWIIRGVNGEIYPCKPDIFTKTYEIVDEDLENDKSSEPVQTMIHGVTLEELLKDKSRLDAIDSECWHLIPVSDGIDSYYWEIRQSIMGANPRDEIIAIDNSEDPRQVIDRAMEKL